MTNPSPLDDEETARHAWTRFRWMMRLVSWTTLAITALVLAGFWLIGGQQSLHFYVATAIAVAGVMLLTGALMSLVFLSSGTGHDESIEDRLDDERPRDED